MTIFKKVQENDITKLAALASKIWHEYWAEILTESQIEYMLENFQSVNAIEKQLSEEHYNYYFISDENNENIGYFGISNKENYIYLSEEYRSKGIGKAAFEKIKQLTAKENLSTIRLTVNKYNTNTINAYKKWGFIITDAVITDIGSGFVMDDYIMEYYL